MQKSKIEWTDYTINPVKGLCPVGCSYCYARRMYKRFHWNEKITLTSRWDAGLEHIKPSRIFVGSTFELFGGFIPDEWLSDIFLKVKLYPWHTFIFLTKQPQNLIKYSPFPDNCWVGISATNREMFNRSSYQMLSVRASVKFVSFEPLLGSIAGSPQDSTDTEVHGLHLLNWVIIGQQTPSKLTTQPKIEWIKDIVDAAKSARVPIFLKDNLIPMIDELPNNCFTDKTLRQEFPKVL